MSGAANPFGTSQSGPLWLAHAQSAVTDTMPRASHRFRSGWRCRGVSRLFRSLRGYCGFVGFLTVAGSYDAVYEENERLITILQP